MKRAAIAADEMARMAYGMQSPRETFDNIVKAGFTKEQAAEIFDAWREDEFQSWLKK